MRCAIKYSAAITITPLTLGQKHASAENNSKKREGAKIKRRRRRRRGREGSRETTGHS